MTIRSYQDIERRFAADDRSFVTTHEEDGVALVTMNDPDRFNCLSGPLTIQLRREIERLNAQPDIRVVILTGAGRAFSAGGDMELMTMAHDALRGQADDGAAIMRNWIRHEFGGVARGIRHSDKIYLAAVNGPAAGVGLAFAFASDIILASDRARFVLAFGKIGLVPEVGSNWFLTRRLGHQKAMELFISGEELDADKARELGLVNRVVDHQDLLETAHQLAEQCKGYPASLLSMTKALMHKASDSDWSTVIEMEEYAEALCFTTQFHQQRVAAFAAKSGAPG